MKKEFNLNDEVYVKTRITHIDRSDNTAVVKMTNGVNPWVDFKDIIHTEPEFVPREMLVWNNNESDAIKRMVIGKIEGRFICKAGNVNDDWYIHY